MEIINELTDEQVAYWEGGKRIQLKAPPDSTDVTDCMGVITGLNTDDKEIHVAWKPNEIELMRMAQGGTIWLTCVGSLPPHRVEVQAP